MKRRVNVKPLAFLVGAALLFALGVHLLHGFQGGRNAAALLEQAERAEAAGQPDNAVKHLRTYLGLVPDDTDALARYGSLLEQQATTANGRLQALLVLEQVLRRDPGRHDVRRRLIELAMHPQVRRHSDAREHLVILLRESPNEGGKLEQMLGRCCEAGGDYAEAARWYEKAIEQGPKQIDSYIALAELARRRLDSVPRAEQVIDQLVARNPANHRALLARARFLQAIGQVARAAGDVARARELAADDVEVLIAGSQLALAQGKLDDARQQLEKALAGDPSQSACYLALADVEIRSGRPTEAVAVLRRGLDALPGRPDLLWGLANLLVDQGHDPEDELRRRAGQGLASPQREFLQARLLAQRGEWHAAVRLLEAIQPGLQRHPELALQVDLLLGQCYGQLGQPDQQYAAYRRAVAADPLGVTACLGLASAQTALGKIDDALETYRRIMPRVPSVRIPMARLLIARNLRLPGPAQRWHEVEQLLDDASLPAANRASAVLLRAEVLAARKEFDAARELLQKARADHPDQVDLPVALAALADRMGQPDSALAVLDEAASRLGDRVEIRLARGWHWTRQDGKLARTGLRKLEENIDHFSLEEKSRLLQGLGTCWLRIGEAAEAERLWTRLAEQSAGALAVRLALFDLALQVGNDAALTRWMGEIERLDGSQGCLARYGRACLLLRQVRQGNPAALETAQRLLDELAAARPRWPRLSLAQAEARELARDQAGAIKHYQRAVELGDQSTTTIRRLVELLYQQRRFAEADELVQKVAEPEMLAPDLQRLAAEVSLHRQDLPRALRLARLAVSGDSKDYKDSLWLGQFLAASGRAAEAESALRKAVELGGTAPESWAALILFLTRSGKKDEAERVLKEARSRLPAGQVALAMCCEALGKTAEARELHLEAEKVRPDDVIVLKHVTGFCLRHGPGDEAEKRLRRLMSRSAAAPEDAAWARRTLAVMLATSGDYRRWRQAMDLLGVSEDPASPPRFASVDDQRAAAGVLAAHPSRQQRQRAIALLEDALTRQPLAEDEQFLLGQLYEASGDWAKARQQFVPLVSRPTAKSRYLVHYAGSLLRRGESEEAELWISRADKHADSRGDFPVIDLKARLLAARGRFHEATQIVIGWAKNADSKPADPAARNLAAAVLLESLYQADRTRNHDWGTVENLYREATALRPAASLDQAAFLGRRNRIDEALKLCENAWDGCPPEAVAVVCLAILRQGQSGSEHQQRVEQWLSERVRGEGGKSAALLVCLADLHDLRGQYPQAEQCYREAIAVDPQNVVALNNLAYLLALRGQGTREARNLLDRAIAIAGPTPELLDTRAVLALESRQAAEAIRDLEQALADRPSPLLCYHLAQAHHLVRNAAAARTALRRGQSLGLEPAQLHPLERASYERLHSMIDAR